MERLRKNLLVIVSFVLLLAATVHSGSSTEHRTVTPDKETKMLNTRSDLAAAADQTKTTAETVRAQPSGVRNTAVAENPAIALLSFDDPIEPFQQTAEVVVEQGVFNGNATIEFPFGKMLVIEQVSAYGKAPEGQRLGYSVASRILPELSMNLHLLRTTSSDVYNLQLPPHNFAGSGYIATNDQLRIYADAPQIRVRIDRNASSGTARARFLVSGYLVNRTPQ